MEYSDNKYEVLRKVWGFETFRSIQEDIIDAVLNANDVLGIMATGGGKSLCYQLPSLMMDGITVVISPLIALMEDQVKGLVEKDLKAIAIHSGISRRRQDELFDNCVYGEVKFLFISPEKLASDIAISRLKKMKINFFVIDEAHCISQWGHDFRPSYLNCNLLKTTFPDTAVCALTATATKIVMEDVLDNLQINEGAKIFKTSAHRPNISITLKHSLKKNIDLLRIINSINGSKIVYARNKRHCSEINSYLIKHNKSSTIYHADIPVDDRMKRQKKWIEDDIEIIVCTSAFGMGIDKSDVRLVIHYDIPPSLEEYSQEIGRAGRDGIKSYAVLLYNNYDAKDLEFHFENGLLKVSDLLSLYQFLCKFLQIPLGGGKDEWHDFDIDGFSKHYSISRAKMRSILRTLESNEYLLLDENGSAAHRVQVIANKGVLNQFINEESDMAQLIQQLLRSYEGLLFGKVRISVSDIMNKLGWNKAKVLKILKLAEKQSLIKQEYKSASPRIKLLTERLPNSNISLDKKLLKKLNINRKKRFQAILDFIFSKSCRATILLQYFEENQIEKCGHCDYCLGSHKKNFSKKEYDEVSFKLKNLLKTKNILVGDFLDLWPWNKHERIKEIIRILIQEGKIINNDGKLS